MITLATHNFMKTLCSVHEEITDLLPWNVMIVLLLSDVASACHSQRMLISSQWMYTVAVHYASEFWPPIIYCITVYSVYMGHAAWIKMNEWMNDTTTTENVHVGWHQCLTQPDVTTCPKWAHLTRKYLMIPAISEQSEYFRVNVFCNRMIADVKDRLFDFLKTRIRTCFCNL